MQYTGLVLALALLAPCLAGCSIATGALAHTSEDDAHSLSAPAQEPDAAVAATPTDAPAATPTDAPAPAETPAPVPLVLGEAETLAAKAAFDGSFYPQWLACTQTNGLEGVTDVMTLMQSSETLRAIGAGLADAVKAGLVSAKNALAKSGVNAPVSFGMSIPEWKALGALYMALGDEAWSFVSDKIVFSTACDGESVAVRARFPRMREALLDCEAERAFSTTFMYAYLRTVYDDEGAEKPFVQYELKPEYLAALGDPLPEGYNIKDGWYDGRQKNSRKHTGTDIRVKGGTEIYSMTPGTVEFVGYNDVAGNYVVILDEHGFEYHYYHMRKLSDFLCVGDAVEKGALIGIVGNTGNSDANHLHLAMVSPDYTYINPYLVLSDMLLLRETPA